MDAGLWVPLAVIFGAATVGALVKRQSKDACLKIINKSFVFIQLKNGRWIWGDLQVYSNALELCYRDPASFSERYRKASYLLYEHNFDQIERILRPSPAEGTAAQREWQREVHRLQHPNPIRKFRRKLRNLFNILRDAFAQSVSLIFGAVKQRTRLGKVPIADDKVNEVGKHIISVVPNAYEPVLEKYLGRRVVIESPVQDKIHEQAGVLQEYTSKYVLLRDVEFLLQAPPMGAIKENFDHRFDVIFPRPANVVRHQLTEEGGK